MAFELSKLNSVPVFMWGQSYLLGVISWLAAPIFAIFGPSIIGLKAPFIVINLVLCWMLIRLLIDESRLHPLYSFILALVVAVPSLIVSSSFVNPSGGHVEPLLYALIMWKLRNRPLWLGLFSGFAVSHRMLSLASFVPALLFGVMVEKSSDGILRKMRDTILAIASAVEVAACIARAGHMSEYYVLNNFKFRLADPSSILHNIDSLGDLLEVLFGIRPMNGRLAGLAFDFEYGSLWSRAALVLLGAVLIASAIWTIGGFLRNQTRLVEPKRYHFPVYLLLCGVMACGMYVLTHFDIRDYLFVRYVFLVCFVPAAVAAIALLLASQDTRWAWAIVLPILILTSVNISTASRYIRELVLRQPDDQLQEIAEFIKGTGLRYGIADYWVAHNLGFRLAGYAVVASSTFERAKPIQDAYAANKSEAFRVVNSTSECFETEMATQIQRKVICLPRH
jgi:hypothetical protein